MIAVSFICLVVVLWTGKELIIGIWAWVDYRKLKHTRNTERTRRQFAEARNELMRAAIEKQVDFNSMSFQYFYRLNTAFMRRPDQYREIMAAIAHSVLNPQDSKTGEEVITESSNWSPEFKRIVKTTADAMGYLLLDYSLFLRIAFRLEKRFNPESTPILMLRGWAEKFIEKEPPLADIRHTQNAMYRLAAAA